jgi:hypothetical protein
MEKTDKTEPKQSGKWSNIYSAKRDGQMTNRREKSKKIEDDFKLKTPRSRDSDRMEAAEGENCNADIFHELMNVREKTSEDIVADFIHRQQQGNGYIRKHEFNVILFLLVDEDRDQSDDDEEDYIDDDDDLNSEDLFDSWSDTNI